MNLPTLCTCLPDKLLPLSEAGHAWNENSIIRKEKNGKKRFNLHWKDRKTLCNGRPYLSAKSFHFMRNFLGLGEGSGSFNLSAKNSTNFCSSNKRGTR